MSLPILLLAIAACLGVLIALGIVANAWESYDLRKDARRRAQDPRYWR